MHALPCQARVLHNRVREARQARGWTQRELAARAGIAYQIVVWVERGREGYAPMSVSMVALANALGVEWGWLWYLDEPAA